MATIELDVRGMQAPEPLERVLQTLDRLGDGDRLLLKINCRPVPLFRILERNGYTYEEQPGVDSLLEIAIRKAAPG
jgi:TusA-related sulfurtransferase